MNSAEFINAINEKMKTYNFLIEEDCDLWCLVEGILFYRNLDSEKPFAHITGVGYSRDGGTLEGDFDGFMKHLDGILLREYC